MIVNRHNYFERLKNFDVRVGVNKDNLQNPTCHDRVRTVGQGQALRVQCDPPIPGRYVSVQMFGEGILSMCEVTVYSRVGKCVGNCLKINEQTKNKLTCLILFTANSLCFYLNIARNSRVLWFGITTISSVSLNKLSPLT